MSFSPARLIALGVFSLLVFESSPAAAFEHLWSRGFGDDWPQAATRVALSPAGDVIFTGDFMGSIDLGGGPLTSAGEYDIFLAAFSPQGAHLWSRRFGSVSNDKVRDLAVDADGDIVLVGDFFFGLDFGGGILPSAGDKDAFAARLDAEGQHLWSASFGGGAYDAAYAVACDGSGDVILAGQFRGELDLGGGPLSAGDGQALFCARLDGFGAHLWSRCFGEYGEAWSLSVAAQSSEGILLAGSFAGVIDFGGGLILSQGGQDAFLAALTPAGAQLWSRACGGPEDQRAVAAAFAPDGGALIAGDFAGSIDLGGGPVASAGAKDLFLARYGSDGAHVWSRRFGDAQIQQAGDLAAGPSDLIALTGKVAGSVNFGGGALMSAGGADLALAMFDGAGEHRFGALYGDGGDQGGEGLDLDAAGGLVLSAMFGGELDLGGGPLIAGDGFDVAVGSFLVEPSGVPVPAADLALRVHPNPFNPRTVIAFSLDSAVRARLEIFAPDGRCVARLLDADRSPGWHEIVWNASGLPSGLYIARLTAGGQQRTGKLVLIE